MEIMRLNGVDARLYPLVGPLVMNPVSYTHLVENATGTGSDSIH